MTFAPPPWSSAINEFLADHPLLRQRMEAVRLRGLEILDRAEASAEEAATHLGLPVGYVRDNIDLARKRVNTQRLTAAAASVQLRPAQTPDAHRLAHHVPPRADGATAVQAPAPTQGGPSAAVASAIHEFRKWGHLPDEVGYGFANLLSKGGTGYGQMLDGAARNMAVLPVYGTNIPVGPMSDPSVDMPAPPPHLAPKVYKGLAPLRVEAASNPPHSLLGNAIADTVKWGAAGSLGPLAAPTLYAVGAGEKYEQIRQHREVTASDDAEIAKSGLGELALNIVPAKVVAKAAPIVVRQTARFAKPTLTAAQKSLTAAYNDLPPVPLPNALESQPAD